MESSIILSIFSILIFILLIFVGYLLLSDFNIVIDNEKPEENIS